MSTTHACTDHGIFFVQGHIEDDLIQAVAVPMVNYAYKLLEAKESKPRITIVIDSNGGYLGAALGFVASMKHIQMLGVEVCTHVSFRAMSAASLIAAAGTKGRRTISTFGFHLVHYGTFGRDGMEHKKDLQMWSKHWDRYMRILLEFYTNHTTVDADEIEERINAGDWLLSSFAAVECGFADMVEYYGHFGK